MIRLPFHQGWTVAPKLAAFESREAATAPVPVAIPHDALRELPRGVYRAVVVYVNGDFAAHQPDGYAAFAVAVDAFPRFGRTNTITVEARAHRDSRWYTGAGIYRTVHLVVADPVHLSLDGTTVTTPDISSGEGMWVYQASHTLPTRTASTRSARCAALSGSKRTNSLLRTGAARKSIFPSYGSRSPRHRARPSSSNTPEAPATRGVRRVAGRPAWWVRGRI